MFVSGNGNVSYRICRFLHGLHAYYSSVSMNDTGSVLRHVLVSHFANTRTLEHIHFDDLFIPQNISRYCVSTEVIEL